MTSKTNFQHFSTSFQSHLQPHESAFIGLNKTSDHIAANIWSLLNQLKPFPTPGILFKPILNPLEVLPKHIFNPIKGLQMVYMKFFTTKNQPQSNLFGTALWPLGWLWKTTFNLMRVLPKSIFYKKKYFQRYLWNLFLYGIVKKKIILGPVSLSLNSRITSNPSFYPTGLPPKWILRKIILPKVWMRPLARNNQPWFHLSGHY